MAPEGGADSDEEKTEDPTPRRKEEAREEGNVAQSTEVNYALGFLTAVFVLYFFIDHVYIHFDKIFEFFLTNLNREVNKVNIINITYFLIKNVGILLFPVFLSLTVIAIFSNVIQFGFLLSVKALEPKLNRVNPVSGFKQLFSMKSFVELLKSIAKIGLIGYIIFWTIKSGYENYLNLAFTDVNTIIAFLLDVVYQLAIRAGIAMLIIAALDFAYQKWQHKEDLKMTKKEVEDEYKEMEGDPQVKQRIKEVQKEMAQRRMMEEVPEADVVITNPTHFAVAISYDEATMEAPEVVAKGKDFIAQKIKEIARENNIPQVENPPVARSLFKEVEIGEEVPEQFYDVVAEILAYVYKLNNKV